MRIPPLKIKLMLESNPLKSRILGTIGDWPYLRDAPAMRSRRLIDCIVASVALLSVRCARARARCAAAGLACARVALLGARTRAHARAHLCVTLPKS